jgi:predicted alpha/beta-hydrolase family hydrolase
MRRRKPSLRALLALPRLNPLDARARVCIWLCKQWSRDIVLADTSGPTASIAGGKSFGGRMTSQTQAKAPLENVRGLAFLGFPLHAAGRPSHARAEHLFDVKIPMLFLQGTRDTLASLDELRPVCKKLGKLATLKVLADADHSFHVPARTGRKDMQVLSEALDAFSEWLDSVRA